MLQIALDDSELQQGLDNLTRQLTHLEPTFREIGEYLILRTQERFDRQEAPGGQKWQSLAVSTLARKQKRGKILKILQQDGDLRRTVVYQVSPNSLRVGTNRIYGAIHQLGGQAGRDRSVTIPARPYLGVDEEDRREILEIISDAIARRES